MGRWAIPRQVHDGGPFLLRRRDFTLAYLKAYEEGSLRDKAEAALAHLGPSCTACPRLCKGVNRLANQFGVCKVGRHARVASAFPHFGEHVEGLSHCGNNSYSPTRVQIERRSGRAFEVDRFGFHVKSLRQPDFP